jgi:hypothetical protein
MCAEQGDSEPWRKRGPHRSKKALMLKWERTLSWLTSCPPRHSRAKYGYVTVPSRSRIVA